MERLDTDGLPQPGATARVVAELPLARPKILTQRALFVVFPSRRLGTCFTVVTDPETDGLECDATTRCPQICLGATTEENVHTLPGSGPNTGTYVLLSGTLSLAADSLRLTNTDRLTRRYSLTGPPARGLPGRRVFMADLLRSSTPTRVELLADERVIESVTWREMLSARR